MEKGKEYWKGFADGFKESRDSQMELFIEMQEMTLRRLVIKGADGLPEKYVDRIVSILDTCDKVRKAKEPL